MCKFDGYKLTMKLEAQMPMIHFQSEQNGATLRASEMKPKFDKFLLDILCKDKGENIAKLKGKDEYKAIFLDPLSDDNNGLDYKVQITILEPGEEVQINEKKQVKETKYNIFYANTNNSIKRGVFTNPIVTIICFKQALRELIEENIVDFFLTTNFGTMQNKGFGSFAPSDWLDSCKNNQKKLIEDVAKAYQKRIPNGTCYYMDFNANSIEDKNKHCVKISNVIKEFYSIMKSGKNINGQNIESHIYKYGREKHKLGNEKAWMKKNDIAPKLSLKNRSYSHSFEGIKGYKYLRVILGLGRNIEYGLEYKTNEKGIKVLDKSKKTKKITIDSDNKEFERLSSPIYFKVIRDKVFIVAFDVPKELFGKKFKFSSKTEEKLDAKKKKITPGEVGEICAPESFDIQDFLADYVAIYNNKNIRKNNPEVIVFKEVGVNA